MSEPVDTSAEAVRLYGQRQCGALGWRFSAHMLAMTAESLHSKSAIAAELAWRDWQIECRQDAIDRLQSALEAAQQEIAELKEQRRNWLDTDLQAQTLVSIQRELTVAQQRIAALERDLKNERARGIHTCHDQCPRPLCVAHREIADLRNRLNLSEKLRRRFPVDAVQPDQKDVS